MTEPPEDQDDEAKSEKKKAEETPLTEEGLRRILVSFFVVIAVGVAVGILVFKML